MSKEPSTAGFTLPDLALEDKANRILAAALGERGMTADPMVDIPPIHWEASYFGLHRVSIFQGANAWERQQILSQLNQGLVQESIAIEQAGVGYMAKMVLMAESIQERMLYGLFVADETLHLAQLQPYGYRHRADGDNPTTEASTDPFLQLLAEIVESCDKTVLLFVLQVVLEGWGLTHYRQLARGCITQPLRDLFQSFLQAEARHHGAGVTLFHHADLSAPSQAAIVDCLAMFLQMIRVGPQRVLGAIATHKGHLSRPQRIQILQQLDTVAHSHQRLQLLKSIMSNSSGPIVAALEQKDLFTPLSPEEAASYG